MQYNTIINKLKPCCTNCEHCDPQTMQIKIQPNPDEIMLAVEVGCHYHVICRWYTEMEDEE